MVEVITNSNTSSNSTGETVKQTTIDIGFSSQTKYKYVGHCDLSTITDENEILKDIAKRIQHKRRLIIPIGLPNSGKSMFIASLIAYAFRRAEKEDNSCNFEHVVSKEESGIQSIIDALNGHSIVPGTNANHFSIIDLDMKSRYRNRKIKVSLLDFAGEDIERLLGLKPDEQQSGYKIGKILDACIAQKAIFAIITPVDENFTELGEVSDFDEREDTEMKAFIDKVKSHNPRLYQNTKFLLVVTKSDKLPKTVTSSVFLKKHRNQLYNEYSSNSKSYGLIRYSVGDVVGETIIDVILRSPKNFWYTLYRWCTGMHVLPWWKRIFS